MTTPKDLDHRITDLLPDTFPLLEKFAIMVGWCWYHQDPETIGAICQLIESDPKMGGVLREVEIEEKRQEIMANLKAGLLD